ncbi:hypothetical protein [Streptomyces galilaeus]|uniref:Lipoprotein n=1 Tax=Streptomyces galilaeus TaxID=33899 RepID=A0ABW9IWE1_STRGJ
MNTRTRTVGTLAALTLTLALTACSSEDSGDQADAQPSVTAPAASTSPGASPKSAGHYDSAQDIADALTAAGLTASKPQEQTEENYISQVGGTAYDFTVTDQAGTAAPGTTGINMFPNPEALAAWIPLSKQFGGVAVTGDTWAVSLPTKSKAARDDSKRLAPEIAEALDGTVQQ